MAEKYEYEGWVILELFGHRRLGGRITIAELGGAQLIRIDVHETCEEKVATQTLGFRCLTHDSETPHDQVVATQFYGGGAIYCLTPCTEAIARNVAKANRPEPVHEWEIPRPRLGHASNRYVGDDDNSDNRDDEPF